MFREQTNIAPFLARLTRRSRLTDDERRAILQLPAHAAQIQANVDFVSPDQTIDHACIVVAGLVARFGQTASGERQITALHLPGEAPDLHSVVQPKARSAFQALTTATILRVPHTALRAVAARYPAVAEAFWRDCMSDAAITSQWVVNVGRRDARTRTAHLFCEMAVRYDAVRDTGEVMFDFPVTQLHLADATGLTAVHVNRTLRALRDEKLLVFSGKRARIPDWDGLAARGEFDAEYLQMNVSRDEPMRITEALG